MRFFKSPFDRLKEDKEEEMKSATSSVERAPATEAAPAVNSPAATESAASAESALPPAAPPLSHPAPPPASGETLSHSSAPEVVPDAGGMIPAAEHSLPPAASGMDAARLQRVSESLLENEALSADLDDKAAQVALAWALDCARGIVADTHGLDDAQAEENMYPRLRALRKLMRSAANWAAAGSDAAARAELLPAILELAAVVYAAGFEKPAQLSDFSDGENPVAAIEGLRKLVEMHRLA